MFAQLSCYLTIRSRARDFCAVIVDEGEARINNQRLENESEYLIVLAESEINNLLLSHFAKRSRQVAHRKSHWEAKWVKSWPS